MDSTAPSGPVARAVLLSSLVLLVALPGCEIPVEPDTPDPPSELTLLLDNPQWALDSIAQSEVVWLPKTSSEPSQL